MALSFSPSRFLRMLSHGWRRKRYPRRGSRPMRMKCVSGAAGGSRARFRSVADYIRSTCMPFQILVLGGAGCLPQGGFACLLLP